MTGVQTCALPICENRKSREAAKEEIVVENVMQEEPASDAAIKETEEAEGQQDELHDNNTRSSGRRRDRRNRFDRRNRNRDRHNRRNRDNGGSETGEHNTFENKKEKSEAIILYNSHEDIKSPAAASASEAASDNAEPKGKATWWRKLIKS